MNTATITVTIPTAPLSWRELALLGAMNRGLSIKGAARDLGVPYSTLKKLAASTRHKLVCKTTAQAIATASRLGYVQ